MKATHADCRARLLFPCHYIPSLTCSSILPFLSCACVCVLVCSSTKQASVASDTACVCNGLHPRLKLELSLHAVRHACIAGNVSRAHLSLYVYICGRPAGHPAAATRLIFLSILN